jgi:hypothetical protein
MGETKSRAVDSFYRLLGGLCRRILLALGYLMYYEAMRLPIPYIRKLVLIGI